jgi:hypothetical protein
VVVADGFLGRWSKRKLDVKDVKDANDAKAQEVPPAPRQPVIAAQAAIHATNAEVLTGVPLQATMDPGLRRDDSPLIDEAQVPPPLTLADAEALTPNSDFKPFMARSVTPEVKNAAMKKLFADPHFNVMDRLDTYIDDYSKPDPIPADMLRRMVGAQLLGLFDEEEKQEAAKQEADARLRDDTNNPQAATVAPSYEEPDIAPGALPDAHNEVDKTSQPAAQADAGASQDHDAHTDLRLQPDDAAPAKDAGGGAG